MDSGRPGLARIAASVLLSLLAVFGTLAAPAPAQLSAAAGLIEESQSASPQSSAESVTEATARPRWRRRVRTAPCGRRLRPRPRWMIRSWTWPVRLVGGVPPGRAPPSFAASF